jgi:DNA-binding beta-propeller fold protein YncE
MKEKKRIRAVVTGILCSMVLTAFMPILGFGVEYTSLVTISSGLKFPSDVAASDAGNIYAIDIIGKKLLIYNSNYRLTANVYTVARPISVSVSGDKVYVADSITKSVKILSSSGTVIGDLKRDGVTATFRVPRNLAVDAGGNVFVVDQVANTIEVFNAGGNYSYTISGLSLPQDAVVVGSELFIIDQPSPPRGSRGGTLAPRFSQVRIFDLVAQTFVVDETRTFPDNGNDRTLGQFISLKGIAADSQSNLYLTDAYLHVVYKYDTNGQFLGTIYEPVKTPQGVTISPDGRLMICSSRDATIKVLGVDYEAGFATWINDASLAEAGKLAGIKSTSPVSDRRWFDAK